MPAQKTGKMWLSQLPMPWAEKQPQILTNWVAIAGSMCSGKTTMCTLLNERFDWPVMPDYARDIYGAEFERGKDLSYVEKNAGYYQRRICRMRLDYCAQSDPNKVILFDYGLPCDLAWHKYWKLKPKSDLLAGIHRYRYKAVFLMEPAPMEHDKIRKDSIEKQLALYKIIKQSYHKLGYEPIHVPVLADDAETSINRRFNFILDHLERTSLIPSVYQAL